MIPTIYLASTSPRRKQLMRTLGLPFRSEASRYDESIQASSSPRELVRALSYGKVAAVANRHRTGFVVGADTIVVFQGSVLGKPKTAAVARRMLRKMNGKSVNVLTGLTVMDFRSGKMLTRTASATVNFRRNSKNTIDQYVATSEPLDKAGAFAIQGRGATLVRSIKGDYECVIGLPTKVLAQMLRKIGIPVSHGKPPNITRPRAADCSKV